MASSRYEKQAEKLRNVVQEQKKTLESKDQALKEQAERLGIARQHIDNMREKLKGKNWQIFQLRNELRVAQERVEGAPNSRPAFQVAVESKTGALPDFIILGAQKCGTTSLFHLLNRHPHVERAALKESRYFDKHFDEGSEWYRLHFPPPRWKDGRRSITGEASTKYLLHPRVPERIAKVVPQARLIVLLRNPVDRAYSQYQHWVRNARESQRFEEAVEAEMERLLGEEDGTSEHELRASVEHPGVGHSNYLKRGIYVDQLLPWSKFFSDEQMLVLKSEDFFERPRDILKLVLNFLGLSEWEPKVWEIRNKGHYKEINPATRQWLEVYFDPHNRRLYEYLGVDFGW